MVTEGARVPEVKCGTEFDVDLLERTLSTSLDTNNESHNKNDDDVYKRTCQVSEFETTPSSNVDKHREERWMRFHVFCNVVLLALNITAAVLLNTHYNRSLCKWSFVFLGVSSSIMGIYFFWNLERLTHPRTVYMTMRWLNVLYYISLSLEPFLLVIILSDEWKHWVGNQTQLTATRSVLYTILFMTSFELMLCFSLLTGLSSFIKCSVLNFCGPCCIYRTHQLNRVEKESTSCEIQMSTDDVP